MGDLQEKDRKKYLFDLHSHTLESSNCATSSAEQLILSYINFGYSGALITDHYSLSYINVFKTEELPSERLFNGYRAAKKAGDRYGFKVFPGMEIKFVDSLNEFLIIGIEENWLKDKGDIYKLGLETFKKKYGHEVLIIQAHPFRKMCSMADHRFIDGIEVANGSYAKKNNNSQAYEMWEKNRTLIATAGTDAHSSEEVGTAGVYFYDKIPSSMTELVIALKSGEYELAGDKGIINRGLMMPTCLKG